MTSNILEVLLFKLFNLPANPASKHTSTNLYVCVCMCLNVCVYKKVSAYFYLTPPYLINRLDSVAICLFVVFSLKILNKVH